MKLPGPGHSEKYTTLHNGMTYLPHRRHLLWPTLRARSAGRVPDTTSSPSPPAGMGNIPINGGPPSSNPEIEKLISKPDGPGKCAGECMVKHSRGLVRSQDWFSSRHWMPFVSCFDNHISSRIYHLFTDIKHNQLGGGRMFVSKRHGPAERGTGMASHKARSPVHV